MGTKYKTLIYHEPEIIDDAIGNIEAVYVYTLQECLHRLSLFSYDRSKGNRKDDDCQKNPRDSARTYQRRTA